MRKFGELLPRLQNPTTTIAKSELEFEPRVKRKSRAKDFGAREWLTRTEVAEMLGLGRNATVSALIADGTLKTVKTPKGGVRITLESYEAYRMNGSSPVEEKPIAKKRTAPRPKATRKPKRIRYDDV